MDDALNNLKQRGYHADFSKETVCLYCLTLDVRLYPEDFNIDETYRAEGDDQPDGSSILYAITSVTGLKGTLIDLYGPYTEHLSFEMAKKLKVGMQYVIVS